MSRFQFSLRASWNAVQSQPPRSNPNTRCSFCFEVVSVAGPFVEGPGRVFICDGCSRRIAEQLKGIPDDGVSVAHCSFNRHRRQWVWPVATGPTGTTICRECAELAQEIIKLERARRQAIK